MENKKLNLGDVRPCDPRFVANKGDLYSIVHDNVRDYDIHIPGVYDDIDMLEEIVDIINLIPWNVFYIYNSEKLIRTLYNFLKHANDPDAARLTLTRVAHEFRATKTGLIRIKDYTILTEDIHKCLRDDWYLSGEYIDEFVNALGSEFSANHSIRTRVSYGTTTTLSHNTAGSYADTESLFVIQLRNIFKFTDDRYRSKYADLWIHKALANYLAKINISNLKVDEDRVPEKYRGSEFGIKLAAILPFIWAGPRDITRLDYKIDTLLEKIVPKIQEEIDKLLADPDNLMQNVIDRYNIYIGHLEAQQPDHK